MNDQSSTTLPRLTKLQQIKKFVRKYKWIVIGVLIVIIGLIALQVKVMIVNNDWKKATDYYHQAKYDKAGALLNDMPMPSDADKLNIYAQTMLATQKLDKAVKAYTKLYEIKKDPFAKLVLGNIYNQQKKYDQATKIYDELIKANPAYIQAYVNLSTLYKLQNNSDGAIKTAKEGVAKNPTSTVLYELLVSMTMDKKDSEDYKTAITELKKLNPNSPLIKVVEK